MTHEGPSYYDIVIPVYNAYEDLVECIDSILAHTDYPYNIIIVEDCSTDRRIKPYLEEISSKISRITVLYNEVNLGFVKSVNRGMRFSKSDVVLLNSDTILTRNWLSKMNECAYSSKYIATVTPFTNNGTICSVPNFGIDNTLPDGFTIDSFAAFIEMVSFKRYPVIPTAVGFCMLIKRTVLDEIGYFDEESYGKGYGEENDFCCRVIENGYFNVIDDATYIFHKGSMSFRKDKEALINRNSTILHEKFPYFFSRVEAFLQNKPISELLDNINVRMKTFAQKPRILIVVHNTIDEDWLHKRGGTELHILDLISKLQNEFVFYTLVTSGTRVLLKEYFGENVLQYNFYLKTPIEVHTFFHDEYKELVTKIINTFKIDLVHIHHFQRHTFDIPYICRELNVPIFLTIHDFYLICPTILLLDTNGNYCLDNKTSEKCHHCLSVKMGYHTNFRLKWSSIISEMLKSVDLVIFPSESAQKNLEKEYNLLNIETKVLEHGIKTSTVDRRLIENHDLDNFKVAFLGTFALHKGSRYIADVLNNADLSISWYLLGDIHDPILADIKKDSIYKLGGYNRENIAEILQNLEVDLVCLLSICPETYSFTLSESWAAGIPVLVNDIGALGGRVKNNETGWIVQDLKGSTIYNKILEIKNNPDIYRKVKENVIRMKIKTIEDMANEYQMLYSTWIQRKLPNFKENIFTNEELYSNLNIINSSNIHLELALREKENELQRIYNTLGWRFLSYFRKNKIIARLGKKLLLFAWKIKQQLKGGN